MSFYSAGIFYGSGAKYIGATTTAAQGIPIDLRFYRTSQDGIYTFWFGFDPAFITPALAIAGFDLELDTDPSFTSSNLVSFTQLTAITYQNGNVKKGLTVPVAARLEGIEQTWYARVRTHTPSFISDWSATLTWTIPQKTEQQYAESLMKSLPDAHVYGKGDLLKPPSQRNSNLYVVEDMYGNQLDKVWYENFLTQTDNYVDMCRDEFLEQNYGVLFNFSKPVSMQYVDYRWILMNLFLASLVGSTNEAIILTVSSFTGVPPTITNVRDINNFILTTTQDSPITQALETTTIVSVVDGTHLEVGSTIGWVVGSALDTTVAVPFIITDVEDSTHLIVNNTAGMFNGDIIKESIFYTSSPFIDATLGVQDLTGILIVANTAGFTPGLALDTTTLAAFTILSIINSTQLEIIFGSNINATETITQGSSTTTVTSSPTGGLVSPSLYTTEGALGYFTMNAPTTDTLQAIFDTGNPIKIFDALSGSTILTGLVTFNNGSSNIGGSGTLFLSELAIGQQITDPAGIYLGTVQLIISNTSLILTEPWAGPTEVVTAHRLQYTDTQLPIPTLWDKATLAWGVLITINNPGNFPLY